MAEMKTLPMVPPTCARIDHLSVLFFLDFLITEKKLSVVITTKQAICEENCQFIAMTNVTSGNAGTKFWRTSKLLCLLKLLVHLKGWHLSKSVIYVSVGKDSCDGDSGGPLVYREASSSPWYQVGIVSFGTLECGIGVPGVYTRVSAFIPWLKQNMKPW